jgi:hypothetical protein
MAIIRHAGNIEKNTLHNFDISWPSGRFIALVLYLYSLSGGNSDAQLPPD